MADLLVKNGRVLVEGEFINCDLLIAEGIIKVISADQGALLSNGSVNTIDVKGKMVLPGFIDIHTHGAVGVDVNAADSSGLDKISGFFASQGCTRWLASVLTDTEEKTTWCMNQIQQSMQSGLSGAQLLGVHLEGPFLNASYKGAMPEKLLQKANLELFQRYEKASQGIIRYTTLSPELEGVMDIVDYAAAKGITVAIGHSGATYDQAMESIRHGVRACTHTFNGMRLFNQHEPALMGAVLESDDVYCEAICDGLHLHPGAVRMLLKIKGSEKFVAVTDSIMAAGLPDGEYKLGVNEVIVHNGDARLKHADVRAGSTLTMSRAFRNLLQMTGKPIEEIVGLLSLNQARLLGIDNKFGSLRPGKVGDLTIWTDALELAMTVVEGEIVYQNQVLLRSEA